MNCKGCMYEGTDCMICCHMRLKEAWNELLKEIPFLRRLAVEEIVSNYREDGYEEKERKDMNRYG